MKLALAILLLALPLARALTPAEADPILRGEQALTVRGRAPIAGQAVAIDGEDLVFRSTRGGGTLEYRYPLETVESLRFPGGDVVVVANEARDAEDFPTALVLMDALYQQRAPFLELLTPDELTYFYRYAQLQFEHGDPYAAVGAGRALLPHIENPALERQTRDLVLLAHYKLPLKDDTRALAQEWIAVSEPYGPSALGYYVLGRMAFDEERFDEALWQALEPVAFSSQFPMDYLDFCYALAVAASVELEDTVQEAALREEMARRGLEWPEFAALDAYREPVTPEPLD